MIQINRNPPLKELRLFAAVFFPAFWVMLGWIVGRSTGLWTPVFGVWTIVVIVSVAGVVSPRIMRPVYVAMVTAVFPIGWVVSHVLLASVYFVVLTPIGFLIRLLGKDPMERTLDRRGATYWKKREPVTTHRRYFRQF